MSRSAIKFSADGHFRRGVARRPSRNAKPAAFRRRLSSRERSTTPACRASRCNCSRLAESGPKARQATLEATKALLRSHGAGNVAVELASEPPQLPKGGKLREVIALT